MMCRGEGGELRLGIRRAAQTRNGLPDSVIRNQNSYPNILSQVANAIASKSTFHVFYSPRATHADFIIPYHKYVKSINNQIAAGARFKMRCNLDDSSERRFSGVVSGVGDLDPFRWSNSKWRCLKVSWDEDISSNHQERVSPWEIDCSVPFPPLVIQSSPRMKKLRTCLQATMHGSSIAGSGSVLDFEESLRSSKVLQGQENVGLVSTLFGCDKMNCLLDFEWRHMAYRNPARDETEKKTSCGNSVRSQPPTPYGGFLESNRFPKVLQGQEICSLRSLAGKSELNVGAWLKLEGACDVSDMYARPKSSCYPVAPEFAKNSCSLSKGIYTIGQDPDLYSYMTNVQMQNNVLDRDSLHNGGWNGGIAEEGWMPNLAGNQKPLDQTSVVPILETHFKRKDENSLNGTRPVCKLFGFSLIEEPHMPNLHSSNKRSCTKVHKQGSLVGRAIDLSRLHGYDDLLIELERVFSMEGLLRDPQKGWRVLYTDSENDTMVVGDDPWHDFCEVVCKIHLYSKEQAESMTSGAISDDTQSCLEDAPAVADMFKSSSVGQPDSSLAVIRI